jgi:hypothetical protein
MGLLVGIFLLMIGGLLLTLAQKMLWYLASQIQGKLLQSAQVALS